MKFPLSDPLDAGKDHLTCDLDRLVLTKLLVQANSGGGKSWAIRRILEQTFHRVQHLVLDPEGEFSTLREKFDYVLVSPQGGDVAADPRTARLLAVRLLELQASAIMDLYELSPRDRVHFVREFLEGLVDAPKKLWHPVLVVVDEAHSFAPEKGDAESADAVKALASKGRKRGFCAVLATQRLSKLAKDVASECNNKLIGRTGLDVDVKRAQDELGLSRTAAWHLRELEAGEFMAFGPALTRRVVKVKVGPVQTSHPMFGSGMVAQAPPPSVKVKALLQKLSDLPAEAEQKRKTEEDLRKEIQVLKIALHSSKVQAPPEIQRVEVPVVNAGDVVVFRDDSRRLVAAGAAVEALGRDLIAALDRVARAKAPPREDTFVRRAGATTIRTGPPPRSQEKAPLRQATNVGTLTGPEQRILDAVAWWNLIGVETPEVAQVAFVARYSPAGSAFTNPKSHLKSLGLIEYVAPGRLYLTRSGKEQAHAPQEIPSTQDLHDRILERLTGPERRILLVLLKVYPQVLSSESIAAACDPPYSAAGSAFTNPKSHLKSIGLVEYPGPGLVRARDILFPGAATSRPEGR